jgi:hypothetical protein
VRRHRASLAVLLGVLSAAAWVVTGAAYLKYGVRVNDRTLALRWNTLPIRYFLNDQVPAGVTPAAFENVIQRACATWAGVPTAGVSFRFVGTISAPPFAEDGVSSIGFLARPELDRVLGATQYVVDEQTGAIVESDIFLNTTFPWSTASAGDIGRYDVESIALHELGHLLGLGHSALGETELRAGGGRRVIASGAVMFPIAFSAGSIEGRTLRADDIAGVSDLYDGPGFLSETGSLNGRVTKNGAGVYGAHVVAFNPETGKLVGTFTLADDGAFAIAGLDPGTHIVRVEPLDDADLNSFFGEGHVVDVQFNVTFLDKLAVVPRGGNAGPFEIKVAAR